MLKCSPLVVTVAIVSSAFAGDLNPPPGPVASSMKTLDEVEPRTALSQENTPGSGVVLFIITEPGSYYLTGDTTAPEGSSGIIVNADNVTIDLNGFTLRGNPTPGGIGGIVASDDDGLTVRNGTVEGFVGSGIEARDRARIVDVTSIGNTQRGIETSRSSIVRGCNAFDNGSDGIEVGDHSVVTDPWPARTATGGSA